MQEDWQIRLFKKSLKKKQKLAVLQKYVNPQNGARCLDLGCATGVMSYFLRQKNGKWVHADLEMNNLVATKTLIKQPLAFQVDPVHMPLKDKSFDMVVSLDIIEHLKKDIACLHEVHRVLKNEGTLILSVPAIGPFYIVNHLRRWFGMTPDVYGHVREGYTERKLLWMLDAEKFSVVKKTAYSKFFTELIELCINVFYHKLRARKTNTGYKGSITPSSGDDVKKHNKILLMYSFIYPFTWLASQLDKLLLLNKGYAFLIVAKKDPQRTIDHSKDTHPTF